MITKRWPRVFAHVFLITMVVLWMIPMVGMVFSLSLIHI